MSRNVKEAAFISWESTDFETLLTGFFWKEKTLSPKLLQRLQEWVSVCIVMSRNQCNIRGAKSFGYSTLLVWKFTVVASVHLRDHFCLEIKSVDKKQVQTEDNEQLRIWMRWVKPVLGGISNKAPTQFCGSRTTALRANLASSSCFITSFGILSKISASSRFWHLTTTWVVGRCPQHLGSPGCLLRLCGLNSTEA